MSGTSRVSETDLRQLLDVVSGDWSHSTDSELPPEVLSGLAELIPCNTINFFVMDPHASEMNSMQELDLQGLPPDDEEAQTLFFDGYWDCVSCSNIEQLNSHGHVTMWQDCYTDRQFAQLLMAEYFRRVGIWHDLLVRLPPSAGYERRLMLTRDASDPPFSERDRLLLTLLRPHLIYLNDHAQARRRTVPALTRRQVELLQRVARGDTNRRVARDLGISEGTVRKHLEHIYARLGVHSRTEALAKMGASLAS